MQILKTYSHKGAQPLLSQRYPHLLQEIHQTVENINAVDCLTKRSYEASKVKKWGGLLFSPSKINQYFRTALLEPKGWLEWDERQKRYIEPIIVFPDLDQPFETQRYRKMDGIKERVGLEIQFGKYAFMGYDIFSKMIIFRNLNRIDYGIEIVLVQEMVDCMSTGISSFEHLMIDFKYRGEADIDIPVMVMGIGATAFEWEGVRERQQAYRDNPTQTQQRFPEIGSSDQTGTPPGQKPTLT